MLNMARGKPAPEQLLLSAPLLNAVTADELLNYQSSGLDISDFNYGGEDGLPECRQLLADVMELPVDETIVLNNSSLNILFDTISHHFTHGVCGGVPWGQQGAGQGNPVRFICPVPGYDRHFGLLSHFGIDLISVPLTGQGPDMSIVQSLVESDETIKGIICVPKYSNPTGETYSAAVVQALAELQPAAADFRIYWDMAYVAHDLVPAEQADVLPNIRDYAVAAGNADIYYALASTSKITFAGGGISALSTSPQNQADLAKSRHYQTIGPDKINQLRHVRFLKNAAGVQAHMQQHAQLIKPKFDAFLHVFEAELSNTDYGVWTRPKGGYFICWTGRPGTASKIVDYCKERDVILTEAGACFPYGQDPDDAVLRIAPTYPSVDEINSAAQVFVEAVKQLSA